MSDLKPLVTAPDLYGMSDQELYDAYFKYCDDDAEVIRQEIVRRGLLPAEGSGDL